MKHRIKDIFDYSKASVILMIISFSLSVIFYDYFKMKAIYGFWLLLLIYSPTKYLIYSKMWRKFKE